MKEQIFKCCKELRLSSALAENAMTISGSTNQEYLFNVLQAEIKYRNIKRRNLHLKQAGFDSIKTFDGYSFEKITLPSSLTVDLVKQIDFINRQENLILYGRNGAGKSHMATAIGVEACMQGKNVKFYKTAALVNELIDAKSKGSLVKFLKKLTKLDLLICDEWGYIPFDAEGSQLLFQVIADCYEKRSLIITTNIEFSKWNGIFYDDQLTAALIDRLVHHSHLIVFDRDSWRFEHSLMKECSN
jgi:DNA replication protein DnaC